MSDCTLNVIATTYLCSTVFDPGHCSGDYPDSMYSITDPLFFVYAAAACAAIFVAHGFGIIVTCIREAACPTTMKPVAAAHRCFVSIEHKERFGALHVCLLDSGWFT